MTASLCALHAYILLKVLPEGGTRGRCARPGFGPVQLVMCPIHTVKSTPAQGIFFPPSHCYKLFHCSNQPQLILPFPWWIFEGFAI